MVSRQARCAEKSWRALNGSERLKELSMDVRFEDGAKKDAA
jgi:hypothetical protein